MITTLIEKRNDVSNDLHHCIVEQFDMVKQSAENMAECATNIRGHGYTVFIESREDFLRKIDSLQQYLEMIGV
jgi:superoxide dismutase